MPSCRLGAGTLGHTQWGQQVWRFPLTMRGAVAEALEAAAGVRCTVEDVHPVPKAYLEVGHVHPCYRISSGDLAQACMLQCISKTIDPWLDKFIESTIGCVTQGRH